MKIVSKKIRDSARGKDCTLRLPGVCNFNPETTVFAHIGVIRGMGLKCNDNMGIYCCSNCHDTLDSRTASATPVDAADKLRALEETQAALFEDGLLKVA